MLAEKACRVCLSECDELTPLRVKMPGKNKTLEETINFVVNINLKLEDGLPDKICKICESILDLADTFKKRCLESESILGQQAQGKQSDESRPICEKDHQENSEMHSDDTSCLPSSISHTSLTDSLREITENIYDLPEHKIKIEIEEHHVEPGVTISAQEYLDTIKDEKPKEPMFEQCLIKEEFSEETIKYSKNKEFSSFIHSKDSPSPKEPKLDDMQPTTAAVRSPTEDPAAADTSTDTIIKIEANFDEAENFGVIKMENHVKNFKLEEKRDKIIRTKDTATMLKLSGTNTDDKITATETQATCISNTVIGTTGDIHTCDICGYITATVRSLNSHLKAHASTKRYCCDSCLYLTTHLNNFNKHVRSHTVGKAFSCDVCGKKFSSKKCLVSHIRTHTGGKPYSCDVCKKIFPFKCVLDIHLRTHTGEKPYSCDICEKKFIHKYHLTAHLRIHTGEKPYSCVECEKKFRQKSHLNKHIRTHTGVQPYSCDECEKKFSKRIQLIRHWRTHTA